MINRIRTILAIISLGVYVIITLPLIGICHIVRIFNVKAAHLIAQFLLSIIFKFIIFIGGSKLEVKGEENIPDCAVLFTANHRGIFDIVVAYATIKKPMSFIGKIELSRIPVLHGWMKLMNGLFLDRNDIRQGLKTILSAALNISKGISVWIFPEGTRKKGCPETEMLPFKQGSFKIASKGECPIVPVALSGMADALDDKKFVLKPAQVIISFLPPVYPEQLEENDRRHIAEYVQDKIHTELVSLNQNKQ